MEQLGCVMARRSMHLIFTHTETTYGVVEIVLQGVE
jgi:hypothetical protein